MVKAHLLPFNPFTRAYLGAVCVMRDAGGTWRRKVSSSVKCPFIIIPLSSPFAAKNVLAPNVNSVQIRQPYARTS